MITAVKICGLKTAVMLDVAIAAGADYVGLVFYPRSPRHVELLAAARLADGARGRSQIVALVVDADDAALDSIVQDVRPDWLQLHGSESPERVAAIKARSKLKIIKAVKVATSADALTALDFTGAADLILFDAKPPPALAGALPGVLAGALPGGNGLAFDWRLLDAVRDRVPYMLSGGLHPDNVAAAIQATGAVSVDVSSGVESSPGEKDANLIRAFIRSAKGSVSEEG
jgi:phosphoribosylanthranilate isomerase